jgi:outer membrane protein TolC
MLFAETVSAQETKNLSLQEAVDLGIKNSKNLKLSQAKINEAISQYNSTKDLVLPKGSASYTYNHAEIPTNVFKISDASQPFYLPNRADAFIGTVSLQEVIFAGNKFKYAKESTDLLVQSSKLDAEKSKNDIIFNITNAYFNLYKLQQSKKVVEQNLQVIDRQIKQAQRFFEEGIVTKNDVLRFQLHKSNLELSAADLEANRKVVVYNLDIMLGLPENTDVVVNEVSTPGNLSVPVTGYLDSALRNREEIKSLQLHSKAADLNIKSVKSDMLPTVALSGSMYYINPSGEFIPKQDYFLAPISAGATVAWNFDALWLNRNKVQTAQYQKTEIDITKDLVTDNVKTEVFRNYQDYEEALNRIKILETSIAQAQENNKMMESRYTNKVATATEQIDAASLLFQAEINLELAKADAGVAYYTLLKSTGTIK